MAFVPPDGGVPHGSAEWRGSGTSLPPVFPLITAEGPDGAWHSFGPSRERFIRGVLWREAEFGIRGPRVSAGSAFGSFSNARFGSNTNRFAGSRFILWWHFHAIWHRGFGGGPAWRGKRVSRVTAATGGGEVFGPAMVGAAAFLGRALAGEVGLWRGLAYWGSLLEARAGRMAGSLVVQPLLVCAVAVLHYYQYPDIGYNNAPPYDPDVSMTRFASKLLDRAEPDPSALHFNVNASVATDNGFYPEGAPLSPRAWTGAPLSTA